MNESIIQKLKQATAGLLYMSESDEPFEVVAWPGGGRPIDASKLISLVSYPPGTPVKTVSVDDFFRDLTTEQSWYGEAEKADMMRYRSLKEAIKGNLSEVQVFRVGKVQVDIFIIGATPEGDWAGLKTRAVET